MHHRTKTRAFLVRNRIALSFSHLAVEHDEQTTGDTSSKHKPDRQQQVGPAKFSEQFPSSYFSFAVQ